MSENLDLFLTLTSASGRIGRENLARLDGETNWKLQGRPSEDDDPTVEARFVLSDESASAVDYVVIDGGAWRQLESAGDLAEVVRDALSGCDVEAALRAKLDEFENHFIHERCDTSWKSNWSCACNDRCPKCGLEIEPHRSDFMGGLSDVEPLEYLGLQGDIGG